MAAVLRFGLRTLTCLLAAPALLAALAVPARANVAVSRARIVVMTRGARVEISRRPFRLTFADGAGRAVLSEVANTRQAPRVQAPIVDPLPPGVENRASATLYAPLGFLVGSETFSQYEGLIWGGNLKSGSRAGVQYSARNVLSARATGGGVSLVVATSDPSGRRLLVRVAPLAGGALSVSARLNRPAGVATLGDSFSSGPDEGFFGFGGRHNALDQHGNVIASFVEEENLNGLRGAGTGGNGTSLYPNGPTAAYYPQAEFVSSRPYGFLLKDTALARFRLDSDRRDAWNVTESAPQLDYVLAPGNPERAIGKLTALSGRQPVPPRWALGPMLDRLVKNFGETDQDYQANIAADLGNISRYGLPLTAYRIEGWGLPTPGNDGLALHSYTSPAEQARTITTLRARGIHPLVYLRPWVSPASAPVSERLVARHADGSPYLTSGTTGQPIALLDFSNPAAVRYWQREVAKAFDLGADGFMQDFGEEVLLDMHFADGETGATMHNRYLDLYARATRTEIDRYERLHPARKLWFFDRAGYSGWPGSAAYEGGNFPGDETTDWTRSSGLASLSTDMLSRAVGGAYGFGTDIGGYFDLTTPQSTKELFLRWAEWAALSPIFRLHGSGRAGTHTPWSFDAQTVRVYNQLSRVHLRAVPLILSLWRAAARTGMPVTRPLWLAYPGDAVARRQDQEWLLGPDVLVAPVVTEGASSRSVYFPRGCWRAADNHETHVGPRSAAVRAPLTRLPYFVRCGTAPLG
jgi:alpha-glucosidase